MRGFLCGRSLLHCDGLAQCQNTCMYDNLRRCRVCVASCAMLRGLVIKPATMPKWHLFCQLILCTKKASVRSSL